MNDNVFGEMKFNVGWHSAYTAELWGKRETLDIVVSAYENELPSDVQKAAFKSWTDNFGEFSRESLKKLKECLDSIAEDITNYSEYDSVPDDVRKIVSVNHVLVTDSGAIAVMCDTVWDTHGLMVLWQNGEITVTGQDAVMFL